MFKKHILIKIGKIFLIVVTCFFALVAAILLFFNWQTNQRETKTPFEAAPATGRFVQAADVQVFVQERGPRDGTPVLLIHGTGAWSELWRETMETLGDNSFRALAIDVPPFGFSEKPEGASSYSRKKQAERLIGALDSLGIDRINLVSHSVGARPSIEAVLRAQNRIHHLVLVDPALGFNSDPRSYLQFEQNNPSFLIRSFFALKPLRNAALATYGTNPLLTKTLFQSFVFNKEAVTNERVKAMQKPLVTQNMTRAQGDWLEYFLVFPDTSLASDFSNFQNITVPVTIIWGEKDTVTPLWQGKKLQELIPHAELHIMPNVGHIPYIENSSDFNSLLLEILKESNEI